MVKSKNRHSNGRNLKQPCLYTGFSAKTQHKKVVTTRETFKLRPGRSSKLCQFHTVTWLALLLLQYSHGAERTEGKQPQPAKTSHLALCMLKLSRLPHVYGKTQRLMWTERIAPALMLSSTVRCLRTRSIC